MNRKQKRKNLVVKLLRKYVKKYNPKKVKLSVIDNDCNGALASYYDRIDNHICINLPTFRDRLLNGFPDDYYIGRNNKLSFVIHNRKLLTHFIILHELGHSIDKVNEFKKDRELFADNFAIAEMKKQKLLNCNTALIK